MTIINKKHIETLKKVEDYMRKGVTIKKIAKKLKIKVGKNHWDKDSAKYYTFCVNTRKAVFKREQTYSKKEIALLRRIAKNSTSKQIMEELNKINPNRKWPGVKHYIHSVLSIDRKHMIYRERYYKFKKPKPSKDFAWFLGVMAGDGSTSRYYLRLRTVDKNFSNKFSETGKKLFDLKPTLLYEIPRDVNSKKVYQVHIYSSLLVKYLGNWKKENGSWINDLKTRFNWVRLNKGYIQSFLEGLFDSEGSATCDKKRKWIQTAINIAAKPIESRKFIYFYLKKFDINCRILSKGVQITGVEECKKFAYLVRSCIEKREKRLEQIRRIKITNNSHWHKIYKKAIDLKSLGYSNGEIYRKLSKFDVHEATLRNWLLHDIKPRPLIIVPEGVSS